MSKPIDGRDEDNLPQEFRIPTVNPVGIVEYPKGYTGRPRGFSPVLRAFALFFLLLFFTGTVITTAVTLGEYCLTTHGGDIRALVRWVEGML
jgi:hypothetical protein